MTRTAQASALGYAAFALTLWLTSMGLAGWFDADLETSLPLLTVVLGGAVLAIAGLMQWLRGHSLDTVLFLVFAAYWTVGALQQILQHGQAAPTAGFMGWYDIVWALLAFCLWLAAYRDNVARMLFALGLWLSLFALALSNWLHLDALVVLGGYMGLVTAVVGIYIAAAEVINATHEHTVLPLGESGIPDAGTRRP